LYQNEISKNASDVGNLQHDSTLRDDVIRFLKAKWIDSLKISYGVQISLQAPQKMIIVDMKEAPCHYRNDIESLLTVWIISDFDCPLCRELKPVFDSVYYKYQDKIRFADVYFSDEVSSSSIAAECASLQNKYWEVHDSLYAKTFQNKQDLTDLAYTMGMDTMQFNKDFDNYLLRDTITRNINALASKGLFGTPTIIIGRKLFMNVNSVDELSALIDKEWNRL
jgi:protein-disulfide isomerase